MFSWYKILYLHEPVMTFYTSGDLLPMTNYNCILFLCESTQDQVLQRNGQTYVFPSITNIGLVNQCKIH